MSVINRYRVNWTGFTGAPGLSTFYSDGASTAALAAIRTFFNSCTTYLPTSLTLDFPGTGDQLESTTGALTGVWSVAPPLPVIGAAPTGFFAGGTGVRVIWETGVIVNGRRVKGSTFIVPLSTFAYDTNGTMTSGGFSAINNAAGVLAGTGLLKIWSRPNAGGSAITTVSAGRCVDATTNLRTRRS